LFFEKGRRKKEEKLLTKFQRGMRDEAALNFYNFPKRKRRRRKNNNLLNSE
jgi:hypothetical protein